MNKINILQKLIAGSWFGIKDGLGDVNIGSDVESVKVNILSAVSNVISYVGLVAALLIVYGGVTLITAGGDQEKIKKAQGIVTSSIIGLVIILMARVIIAFVIRRIIGE